MSTGTTGGGSKRRPPRASVNGHGSAESEDRQPPSRFEGKNIGFVLLLFNSIQ